jgi:hypothetical protein
MYQVYYSAQNITNVILYRAQTEGRNSSVSIASLYGLEGPGIESLAIPVAALSKS